MDQTNAVPSAPMPQYRSHKIVSALKIKSVEPDADSPYAYETARVLTFVDGNYAPLRVEEHYVLKHNPQAGGYYVVYDDGYASWSPGDVFEAGYTRI